MPIPFLKKEASTYTDYPETNKMNYIKIELNNSLPMVSMEYDSMESFQKLMFCIISESGFNLIYKTIETELIQDQKTDEIEVLRALIQLINKDVPDLSINSTGKSITSPSSFK